MKSCCCFSFRISERPIAIAYTPTEPNQYYAGGDKFSNTNLASSVITEIRDESEFSNDEETDEFGNPSRGDNYQQDFQAPFYPSIKLGNNAPEIKNSWAVVTPAQSKTKQDKISDRSDRETERTPAMLHHIVESDQTEESNTDELVTEQFSMDKFQPDFQSGFKPIYPPTEDLKLVPGPAAVDVQPKFAKHANEDDSIEALVYDDDEIKEKNADDNEEESTTSS